MTGKAIRLDRIWNRETKRTVIIPMDHGAGEGPMPGLINLSESVNKVAEGGANAVIGHVGLALHAHRKAGRDIGLLLHLSVSTRVNALDKNDKVLVNTVENALKMGADGVSVHINIGSQTESEQLRDLGHISLKCMEWGVPLLAMMYPRGEGLTGLEKSSDMASLAARVGAELGADIVKTYYTGDPDSFQKVTEGCMAPVIIAGGSKLSDAETLEMVWGSIQGGGAGVAMGRNAFQHDAPDRLVASVVSLVHENATVEQAKKVLTSKVFAL
ncbi:MAG: 2-amino-3,7-dideoxy-D-threo-hept-6-ulosonate synthase [Candidatus Peregrinibacteria bacterium]